MKEPTKLRKMASFLLCYDTLIQSRNTPLGYSSESDGNDVNVDDGNDVGGGGPTVLGPAFRSFCPPQVTFLIFLSLKAPSLSFWIKFNGLIFVYNIIFFDLDDDIIIPVYAKICH